MHQLRQDAAKRTLILAPLNNTAISTVVKNSSPTNATHFYANETAQLLQRRLSLNECTRARTKENNYSMYFGTCAPTSKNTAINAQFP
jgi:hypothetical protein